MVIQIDFSAPSNTYKAKDGFIHIMAGSDDRFIGLLKSMKKENLFKNTLFNDAQKRLKNQNKIDKIVNAWTKNFTVRKIGNILSKYSVPWGKVKSFSEFMRTKTAKSYLRKAKIGEKNIIVPECAIRVKNVSNSYKRNIPRLGQNNKVILKNLGYSSKNIEDLKNNKIIN